MRSSEPSLASIISRTYLEIFQNFDFLQNSAGNAISYYPRGYSGHGNSANVALKDLAPRRTYRTLDRNK